MVTENNNMNQQTKYYNEIAEQYDRSRFDNTYGQYIDAQERRFLNSLLENKDSNHILDLGCGTGRLLEYANVGIDPSEEMINIAKRKYPNKDLFTESATQTHFQDQTFDVIYSFHVFMHLDETTIREILNETYRILKKGGKLIFDIPSRKRRELINYLPQNWHGATSFSIEDIRGFEQNQWRLIAHQGVLFFPIHRIPIAFRQTMIHTDNVLCQSFLKNYSSYLIFTLEKI